MKECDFRGQTYCDFSYIFFGVKTAQLQDLRPCLEMSIGLGLGVDVLRLVSYGTVIVNITGNYNFIKLFASFYQNCRVTLVTNPFHTMCVRTLPCNNTAILCSSYFCSTFHNGALPQSLKAVPCVGAHSWEEGRKACSQIPQTSGKIICIRIFTQCPHLSNP